MSSSPVDSLVIGTRGSDLALVQSRHVGGLLEKTGSVCRLDIIKTRGDRIQDVPLASMPGKGFFTKEIEDALLAGTIDLAVHSLKDLPTESPPGLQVAAIPSREDPRDCLLLKPEAVDEKEPGIPIKAGGIIATGSIRRKTQVKYLRQDLGFADLRGNVPTRVRKLRETSEYHGIVLANAGLRRLGLDLSDLFVLPLDPKLFLPAPGQGALGLQTRDPDDRVVNRVRSLADPLATRTVAAERRLLALLAGGCHLPLGAHATMAGDEVLLHAFLGDTERWGAARRIEVSGKDPDEVAHLAFRSLLQG